ncbi:MAG TPA: hemolysin III family protein [Pelolinea sp.]|nr:hemolysin III family protein [Pelolinea sp.]
MKIREPFSAISHFFGAAAAFLCIYLLLAQGSVTPVKSISLLIYGVCLFAMFCASGVYHAVTADPGTIEVLRKIDHSAIYLLIAGTYTPFCVVVFSGFWQCGLLAMIWSLALAGIAVKSFIIRMPRWITAGIYVIMGWLSLFAARELYLRLTTNTLGWLVAGGIFYTIGAVIYITKKGNPFPGIFGFHEIWHIFVLLGAAAHFMAVAGI